MKGHAAAAANAGQVRWSCLLNMSRGKMKFRFATPLERNAKYPTTCYFSTICELKEVFSSRMGSTCPRRDAPLLFLKGNCCVSITTSLCIWKTGRLIDTAARAVRIIASVALNTRTQRGQSVEWEDNGSGHQSVGGSSATLYTVLCHHRRQHLLCRSHNSGP